MIYNTTVERVKMTTPLTSRDLEQSLKRMKNDKEPVNIGVTFDIIKGGVNIIKQIPINGINKFWRNPRSPYKK